jgi:hypothetical protein
MGARATAGYDVIPVWLNGERADLGYVKEFRMLEGHRVGRELLRDGFAALRQRLPRLTLASIYEDNTRARRLFTRRVPGVATYLPWVQYRTLIIAAMAGPSTGLRVEVRGAVQECIEQYSTRSTQQQLAWREYPGEMFSLQSSGGTAATGLWRRSVMFGGQWIDVTFLHHLMAEHDDADIAIALVRAVAARVHAAGGSYLVIGLPLGHPLLLPLRRAFAPMELRTVLHLLWWPDEEQSPLEMLDGRSCGVEVATL